MQIVHSMIAKLEDEINDLRNKIDSTSYDHTRNQLCQKLTEKLNELNRLKGFNETAKKEKPIS